MGVLVHQPPVLCGDEPLDLERLPDHRGHDAEEGLRSIEVAIRLELPVYAKRTDDPAIEADGHADEARLFLVRIVARRRAEDQRGLFGDARDDHRLPRFDHFPDDPIAERVLNVVRRTIQPVRRLDVELPAVFVCEHDEAARDGVTARQRLEDFLDAGFRIQRARQRLPDLQQGREPLVLVEGLS